ncbi:hypothetical protein MgSA37_03842 [Mucilaginibacter gotjawali]|uniref:Uncharacterized protein n=2 Tax=Mucilaginibacter gotjawali TaxID=1550579 RepID=A0A0X8X4V1_9SPHI|nr:hypothetical protein [Mucilaginibacter gotjawali]BAU55651.1 hypothetical protein MgSA37_03842 [Mucilaginibacter gotjawali]
MNNQTQTTLNSEIVSVQNASNSSLKSEVAGNPVIERALRRLRESQTNDNHMSHYTKHSSHAVKHSSSW